ncbi:hypothetical protein Tco_1515311 [Tanacetum coccineum]
MHDITYPEMIKRLNDNIPKIVDEMISVTKAFIRGEKAAAGQSKRRGQPWKQQDSNKPHQESNFEWRDDFKWPLRDQKHDRFTPLIKAPKEILAMESAKGMFIPRP